MKKLLLFLVLFGCSDPQVPGQPEVPIRFSANCPLETTIGNGVVR